MTKPATETHSVPVTWAAYGLESVVTWTLTPTSTRTHLRMEQSGFPAGSAPSDSWAAAIDNHASSVTVAGGTNTRHPRSDRPRLQPKANGSPPLVLRSTCSTS